MKWWINRPWNDAPARCDVRRYPQVMMGEVTEADFESAPICRLRLGHKGGHDYTAPPGPGCYRAAASDPDGTQDEYRAAITTPTCANCGRTYSPVALHICTDGTQDEYRAADTSRRPHGVTEERGDNYDNDGQNTGVHPVEAGRPESRPGRRGVHGGAGVPDRDRPDPARGGPVRAAHRGLSDGRGADDLRAASCGDPECTEEHGDEDAPVDTYSDYFHRSNFGDDVPLAPWGGPAPQPPFAARRGLARAWFVRAAIVVLAVVLVLLLGWVDAFGQTQPAPGKPCKAISHRAGATATLDENTVEAITRSASFGAWSEVDVRVLADGKLVLFHDNAWDHKTTGEGVVEETVWADVSGFRTLPNMQAVPTFAAAAKVARQQGVRLVAELKHRSYWSEESYDRAAAIAARGQVYLGGTTGVLHDLSGYDVPLFDRLEIGDDPLDSTAALVLPFNVSRADAAALRARGQLAGIRQTDDPAKWARAVAAGAGRVTTNDPQAFREFCEGLT